MGALRDLVVSVAARRLAAALTLSAVGTSAIVQSEGSVERVYLDPVGIPTVCVGHTATVRRADVGRVFTPDQCARLLALDTKDAQAAVRRGVKVPVTQEQFDALVSLVFNIGGSNFQHSSLLRQLNAGNCWEAGAQFPRWVYAKGRKLPGLLTRRNSERAAFEKGCL